VTMIPGEQVGLASTSDRDDAQDLFNVVASSSLITGGAVTVHGDADGSVAVASGTGMIKNADEDVAPIAFFSFAAKAKLVLTNLNLNFVYVEYHATTPVVKATTLMSVAAQADNVPLAIAYREGNAAHVRTVGHIGVNNAKDLCRRLMEKWGIERVSGTMISETGTRNFALTEGVNYLACCRDESAAFDTSAASRFSYWYYGDAGPAWVEVVTQSQIDKLQYNDYGANPGLANLLPNRYGVHWVYLGKDLTHLHVVYGQGNYTSAQADAAQPPVQLPPIVSQFGMLVGKIIVKQNVDAFVAVLSPFDVTFGATQVTVHNDLAGLQGGQADQYNHLTDAEHTEATRAATNAQSGLATAAQVTMQEGHAARHRGTAADPIFSANEQAATPKNLATTDVDKLFTNEGAAAQIVFNLPTAAAGLRYMFAVQDVLGIQVVAAAGDTIRVGDYVSVAAGAIQSVRVGASIELVAINDTEWIAVDTVGAWQVETSGGVFTYATRSFDIEFTFQNSGAVLNTGVQDAGYTECEIDAIVESVYCYGGQLDGSAGSIVVDIWSDTFSNYPPTVADTICAAAKPTITAAVKSADTTLTGWTKELSRGDGILPNIDSVADLVWAKVVLRCKER